MLTDDYGEPLVVIGDRLVYASLVDWVLCALGRGSRIRLTADRVVVQDPPGGIGTTRAWLSLIDPHDVAVVLGWVHADADTVH